ncbi:MAG: hypothetical protein DME69_12515 [Verrucomicrobia bacterium]|nr:MAG: hypothetical protein DME69_12515 [Verrucomicrobiota bacterium]
MRAIETVLAGEIYASQAITSLAMRKFAGDRNLPTGLDVLSDREMAVFSLIAAEQGTGRIAHSGRPLTQPSRRRGLRNPECLRRCPQLGKRIFSPGVANFPAKTFTLNGLNGPRIAAARWDWIPMASAPPRFQR